MLSEACAVGCPVQTLVTTPLPPKLERFHRALRESGRLRSFDEDIARDRPPPLRETSSLAATVRQRIATRQQSASSA
jgi:hypothetical protein